MMDLMTYVWEIREIRVQMRIWGRTSEIQSKHVKKRGRDESEIHSFLYMKDKGKIGNTKISFNCSQIRFGLRVFSEVILGEAPHMVLPLEELPSSRSYFQILPKQSQKWLLGLKRASKPLKSYPKQPHSLPSPKTLTLTGAKSLTRLTLVSSATSLNLILLRDGQVEESHCP